MIDRTRPAAVDPAATDPEAALGQRKDFARFSDEEALQNIFQPFFTTRHRGSGLGLPIVRKIVEAHDGTIVVENQPGKGCTVIVTVPQGETP